MFFIYQKNLLYEKMFINSKIYNLITAKSYLIEVKLSI